MDDYLVLYLVRRGQVIISDMLMGTKLVELV